MNVCHTSFQLDGGNIVRIRVHGNISLPHYVLKSMTDFEGDHSIHTIVYVRTDNYHECYKLRL